MTLDQATQETFNPPWPSLKSLKLGGMVRITSVCCVWKTSHASFIRWQLDLCWSTSLKVVWTSGFSATASTKTRWVNSHPIFAPAATPGAPCDGRLRPAAASHQPDACPRRLLLWEMCSHRGGEIIIAMSPNRKQMAFFKIYIVERLKYFRVSSSSSIDSQVCASLASSLSELSPLYLFFPFIE